MVSNSCPVSTIRNSPGCVASSDSVCFWLITSVAGLSLNKRLEVSIDAVGPDVAIGAADVVVSAIVSSDMFSLFEIYLDPVGYSVLTVLSEAAT